MAIISISGPIGSGKDTVTKIIQIITENPHFKDEAVVKFLDRELHEGKWKNKKFADKLKDIVCLLLNCTREQLEDREFKEKELGEDWKAIKHTVEDKSGNILFESFDLNIAEMEYAYFDGISSCTIVMSSYEQILTPRLLLQLIGTEAGRNIIHPNIWVNSLMSEYKEPDIARAKRRRKGFTLSRNYYLPNWIISDTRFPNEIKAVTDRGGITVKIISNLIFVDKGEDISEKNFIKEVFETTGEYPTREYLEMFKIKSKHESETALDLYEDWDYIIKNDGNLIDLVEDVRNILIDLKLI